MKRYTAPFALVAFAAAASMASAQSVTWGSVEAELGVSNITRKSGNANGLDGSSTAYALSGLVGRDWGAFGAQAELRYSGEDADNGYDDGWLVALHGNYAVSGALKLGAFVGAGEAEPKGHDRADVSYVGLEGAYSTGNMTFLGQLGTFDSRDSSSSDNFHDGSFARVSGLYALSSESVIEAEFAYYDGEQDNGGSYDMHGYTWGMKYSRQLGARPMAVSLGLEGGHFTNGDGVDNGVFDDMRVMLGFSTWFGGGSLSDARARGIFDSADFGRVSVAGDNVD